MTEHKDEYMTVEDAAAMLRVSIRTIHRNGEVGKVRTVNMGRRTMFHRGDIERLAEEMDATKRPERSQGPPPSRSELVPASELLERVWELQQRLEQAAITIGRLQGQLEQRLLPDDERNLQRRLIQAESERDHLRERLEQMERERQLSAERDDLRDRLERLEQQQIEEIEARRPWWRRLFS
jgi:chromosome segregation ATPase